ncbi:hypothetical protein JL721_12286 [Aureococcus anophagefferens]|nr:hypothetical protein JL721_12286 [Aureococcus anophagefferens]
MTSRPASSALARLRRPRAPRRFAGPPGAFAVVVGSGVSGLAFARALHHYAAVVVLEREAHVGGVWRSQANETSRREHVRGRVPLPRRGRGRRRGPHAGLRYSREPAARRRDLRHLFISIAGGRVPRRGPVARRPVAALRRRAALVCVCANRRLGRLRRLAFPSEGAFGAASPTARATTRRVDSAAAVVVVGAGAFATENARTALEGGAWRVAVVQRRRGSVCPRIVDYLNFSRPYDGAFAHRAEGNRLVFAAWKGAFAACGVTEPECWRAGRLAPAGHTISVSDVWLVAHACGSLSTALGRVGGVGPDAVTVGAASIPCTVILKCVGFWKNAALRRLLGANGLGANNVVRRGLCYQAEAILDNVGGYQSPSGSSYVEGAQLSILLLTAQLRDAGTVEAAGRRLDVVDARASEGLLGLGTSPGAVAALGPRFLEAARARPPPLPRVPRDGSGGSSPRTRDWRALFALCGGAAQAYPFASLLDGLAGEWVDPALALGTAASLRATAPDVAAAERWAATVATAPTSAARPRRAPSGVPATVVESCVAFVLGTAVAADAPLLEAGLDSLGATVFAETLALEASVQVPATIVFDAPSPSAVLRFLSPAADDDGPAVPLSRSTAAIARAVLRFPGGRLVLGLVAAVAAASTHSPRPTSASYGAFLRASFGARRSGASGVDVGVRQLALLDVAGALGPPRSAGVYVAALGFTRPRGGEALEPNAYSSTGDLLSVAAGRVSHALGLEGPCLALDTACSASLVALAIAAAALGRGTCAEAAVAALSVVEATVSASHAVAGLVSPRGRCHAFDGRADGYCRADGLAAYLLGSDGPDDVSGVEARHGGAARRRSRRPDADARRALCRRGRSAEGDHPPRRRAWRAVSVEGVLLEMTGTTRDRTTPLLAAGLDSISAVEFARRLSARAGSDFPATLLFDHPTAADVAALAGSAAARRRAPRIAPGFAARRLNSFGYSGTIAHAAFDDESRFRVSSRLAAASLFRAARELFPVGDGSSAAICELVGRDPTPLSEGTHLSYERRSFGAPVEGRVVVGDLDVASLLFDRSGALLGRLRMSLPLETAFTVALRTTAALETGVLDRSAADVLAIDAIESRPANAVWIDV